MPKLVREIASGGSNERSSEGGTTADISVRNWRLILNSPNENYNVQQEIGVKIGDTHPVNTNLPCVSISEKAEGESRLVRIVTATYKTTPGADPANDPNKQPPDVRPAKFSISSSLIEVPAKRWHPVLDGGQPARFPLAPGGAQGPGQLPFGIPQGGMALQIGAEQEALNPAQDRYDGVSKLVPLITVSIEQFDNNPTSRLDDAGKVNSDDFTFLRLSIAQFTCMLRSISVRPHVESFGDLTYRGFMRTFEFSIKTNGGWMIEQVLEGFNIIQAAIGGADVDNDALMLEHKNGKVVDNPLALATGFPAGRKCRASVPIHFPGGGWCQRPSASPVALNANGSPRIRTANPPVLTQLYLTQGAVPFGNNFSNMGVRILDII